MTFPPAAAAPLSPEELAVLKADMIGGWTDGGPLMCSMTQENGLRLIATIEAQAAALAATACSTRGCQLGHAQSRIAELEQRAHELAQSNVQFEATANDALTRAEAAEADLNTLLADDMTDAEIADQLLQDWYEGDPDERALSELARKCLVSSITQHLERAGRQSATAREEGR